MQWVTGCHFNDCEQVLGLFLLRWGRHLCERNDQGCIGVTQCHQIEPQICLDSTETTAGLRGPLAWVNLVNADSWAFCWSCSHGGLSRLERVGKGVRCGTTCYSSGTDGFARWHLCVWTRLCCPVNLDKDVTTHFIDVLVFTMTKWSYHTIIA